MASAIQDLEVSVSGCCLVIKNVNVANPNVDEKYMLANITRVVPVTSLGFGTRNASTNQRKHSGAQYDDLLKLSIRFNDGSPELEFQIQRVSNQAGWTADKAGLQQASDDICQWIEDCHSGGGGAAGGATEATLAAYTALYSGEDTPGGQDLAGNIINLAAATYSSFTIVIEAGTATFGGLTYNVGTYDFPARPFRTVAASTIDGTNVTVGKIITMG